jgi:hypothetical protein
VDGQGNYLYSTVSVPKLAVGTGYQITVMVFQVVGKDQKNYKGVQVSNITSTYTP